jgi:hypothetical protein
VCGTDAIALEPGSGVTPRLDVQCSLKHNTVAARRALLHLDDVPSLNAPPEPIVVQAEANLFLAPFVEAGQKPAASALLVFEGEALAHGLLVWQGDGNVYDKRLHAYVARASQMPPVRQSYATWADVWGSAAEVRGRTDLLFVRPIDSANPQLDRLTLPAMPRLDPPLPGADLKRLNVIKRAQP